jgi:hypothetical protein
LARAAVRQISGNRAQEQERARTKRKKNEERKLLAFYAKLHEAEARLGQEEEPSVQSTIQDEKLRRLAENDFDYNIFLDNPVMEAGKKMHKELKELEWGACSNCQEYCFNTELDKYKGLCKLCLQNKAGRRAMFGPDNNLMPSQAPECLQRLTPIEKSAISLICPSISMYKKGSGQATKGHCISFFQDVPQMASILPRLPGNLLMIVLWKPTEADEDKSFRAHRHHIMEALVYLKEKNEHYRDIETSLENVNEYPVDGIVQDIPSLNPDELGIPPEQPTALNDESAREETSTVDCPTAVNTILDSADP